MDFTLTEEQLMLQDSVRRYVRRAYGPQTRTALVRAGADAGHEHWRAFADNGWLAAGMPEAYGGLGGTPIETAIVAHELGRALVVEPFVGCAVFAAQTLLASGGAAQKDRYLARMADGTCRLAVAYSEPAARGMAGPVGLRAERQGEAYVLRGSKTLVLGADKADAFIVSAQTAGSEGLTLVLVQADAAGLTRRVLPLHDGRLSGALEFDGVRVGADAILGEPGCGTSALQTGLDHAIVATCAELLGTMEGALELTVEYLKTRKQFGVAIGSFQVLQHRLADMAAEMEVARSMQHAALAALTESPVDDGERRRTVSGAKSLVGRAAKAVCAQAIQLHGGIGMTEEYLVGHYFKRAVVADLLLGSCEWHDAVHATALATTA